MAKFYWLKLPEGWFRDKKVLKLRSIPGGDTYTLIYLKMMLLSLKNEGVLKYEGVEEDFASEIALELNENPDYVTVTINSLRAMGLIEELNEEEILLTQVPAYLGKEGDSAERMRKLREKKKLQELPEPSQCDNVVQIGDVEIEIELEKELQLKIETEIEKRKRESKKKKNTSAKTSNEAVAAEPPFITLILNTGDEYPFTMTDIANFTELYPAVDVQQEFRKMKGWCINNPTKRKTSRGIRKFVNGWLAKEQDRYHPGTSTRVQNRVSEVDSWG